MKDDQHVVVNVMGRYQTYVDAWKRRLVERETELDARRQADLELAREVASELFRCYDAKRVFVFGSLVSGASYDETSDIDLAVEGVPSERYLDAWGLVESLCGSRTFDLVMLDRASDELRSSILDRGVEM